MDEPSKAPLIVAGDLLEQHVIVEEDPVKADLRDLPKPSFREFSILAGSFQLEFILRCCAEYLGLERTLSDISLGAAEYAWQGQIKKAGELVEGPAINKDIFNRPCMPREHITLKKSKSIPEECPSLTGYRIVRSLGIERRKDPTRFYQQDCQGAKYLCLSLDYDSFCSQSFDGFLGNIDPEAIEAVVTRLVIRPSALVPCEVVTERNEEYRKLLAPLKKAVKVAVVSAESLRRCGADLSFRVTWERTINDTVRLVSELVEETRPHSQRLLSSDDYDLTILKEFDWIVVAYHNDAALIVPTTLSPDKSVIFVGDPHCAERDFVQSFDGYTKGTETLVTCSIMLELARKGLLGEMQERGIPQKPDSQHSETPVPPQGLDTESRLQRAVTYGLKASRFLQAHGNVSPEPSALVLEQYRRSEEYLKSPAAAKRDLPGELLAGLTETDLGKALKEISIGEATIKDCAFFLWNRLLSSRFFNLSQAYEFNPELGKADRLYTWPFGDIVEILVNGFPTYGSFPPTALKREHGRAEIGKTCEKTASAWRSSGWFSSIHIPVNILIGRYEPTGPGSSVGSQQLYDASMFMEHDVPWWSFEALFAQSLAGCLEFKQGPKNDEPSPQVGQQVLRNAMTELLAVGIIKYGFRKINRESDEERHPFDLRVLSLLLSGSYEFLMSPYRLVLANLDPVATLLKIFGPMPPEEEDRVRKHFEDRKVEKAISLAQTASSWWSESAAGSFLGVLPSLSIGRLFTSDRRDIQSYRDIRERIVNYRLSDSRKPLNLAVFGQPGSGKSFGVKEVLQNVFPKGEVEFLEFNVAQFGSSKVLVDAFLEIQNVSLMGKLPVAFWDEYDTEYEGKPLGWLSYFLGPMQDGAFFLDQRLRYLPKCVFVFAGSMFQNFGEMRALDKLAAGYPIKLHAGYPGASRSSDPSNLLLPDDSMTFPLRIGSFSPEEWRKAKGSDFKSRLTGVLDIKGVDPAEPTRIKKLEGGQWIDHRSVHFSMREDDLAFKLRRARGIRIAFEQEAKHLINSTGELAISAALLRKLMNTGRFAHGQRSINSLVAMSSLTGRAEADSSFVPTGAQARIHANPDIFGKDNQSAVVSIVEQAGKDLRDRLAPIEAE